MVVFTCGHCGESVQKPKVEKHYLTKCRNRNPNLSCMDCFKDFLGKDYEAHTKCITEEERYSGKGFQVKEKKGEKKQNAWVEILQSVLDEQKDAPGNVRRIIETISKHNNTPRKKPKFINFVKNVCGHKTNPKDIDQAWDFISVKLSDLSNVNNQNNNQKNGQSNGKTGDNDEEGEENGDSEAKPDDIEQNGDTEKQSNGETENTHDNDTENGVEVDVEHKSNKKMSKKERKEEKKRQKYEAELKSAVETPTDEGEIEDQGKKGKKKKSKSESNNSEGEESDKKNKKRKRQDTVNSVAETQANGAEVENEPVLKGKALKKKIKVGEEDDDESECLHNQNVAGIEELSMQNESKFNWHAVIMSVLQKKDNEMPFKRLQKKVLMEFTDATGREVDDRIADKFIKKLKSAPNVRVDKNRVTLVQ